MVMEKLLHWFYKNRRDLPWRHTSDPYKIWVSEIMLQQTRVEAVIPYYHRFLEALPTVSALAEAEEETLLKLWEGLGYYSRVRNMQKAAKEIVSLGEFPKTAAELKKLSGFGDYTSGAVSSIAFGHRAPAVDGNVLRVFARLTCEDGDIGSPAVRKRCAAWVMDIMPEKAHPGDCNQALMELGACVCLPKAPKCEKCPLRDDCGAYREDAVLDFPVKAPKGSRVEEEFTVYLLIDNGKILVRKRPEKGMLAGLYEFPHHIDENNVKVLKKACDVKHVFTHKIWLMHGVFAELTGNIEGIWVDDGELGRLPMASAMEKFRKAVLERI